MFPLNNWGKRTVNCSCRQLLASRRVDRHRSDVISEWELWACANQAINEHGADAPIFAAMRADELFEQGDDDGARTWRLIVERINRLLSAPSDSVRH